MSNVFDYSIQNLAFVPPPKSYTKQENIQFVTTITGDKIAVRVTSHLARPYVHGHEYTTSRRFLLFSHGNGDDLGTCQDYVEWLCKNKSEDLQSASIL